MNNNFSSLTTESSNKLTILYARLSQDDGNAGDSNSIVNQRQMLEDFAKNQHFENQIFLSDDGISGTTFNRPSFEKAIELVQGGKVANFIVKDLSRFGRDYLKVGMFTEVMFPEKNVRFIAINDNVDSIREDENSLAPFRNMFNEWYARDTSKKIRAVKKLKGNAGENLTSNPPFGYLKKPENTKLWVVDEAAAEVVKRIFREYLSGKSARMISRKLEAGKILTPTCYKNSIGVKTGLSPRNPFHWSDDTVNKILDNYVYCGHTVNFKTYVKSYKSHKSLPNARENWKIFKGTHEAIVSEEDFALAQKMRKNRRRYVKNQIVGLFQGLVFCADCGHKHYYNGHGTNDRYYCSGSISRNVDCDNAHSISGKALEIIVLNDFKRVLDFAKNHENEFVEYLRKKSETEDAKKFANDKKRLSVAEKRFSELDDIVRKLFESNVSGKISDERFAKMSAEYENEQKNLGVEIRDLQDKLAENIEKNQDVERFAKLVKKTVEPRKLTPSLVREMLERIELGQIRKVNSRRTQEVKLIYRFVGEISKKEDEK